MFGRSRSDRVGSSALSAVQRTLPLPDAVRPTSEPHGSSRCMLMLSGHLGAAACPTGASRFSGVVEVCVLSFLLRKALQDGAPQAVHASHSSVSGHFLHHPSRRAHRQRHWRRKAAIHSMWVLAHTCSQQVLFSSVHLPVRLLRMPTGMHALLTRGTLQLPAASITYQHRLFAAPY